MEYISFLPSEVGLIQIMGDEQHILRIVLTDREIASFSENTITKRAKQQLMEYFSHSRQSFDLPLLFKGTDFQLKVWKELTKIPYGDTIHYQKIAKAIDSPKASRAVGSAVGKNPFFIVNPCHRVHAKNGLGGFAYGLACKEHLLALERK